MQNQPWRLWDPDADLETGKLVERLADDSCSGFDGPNRTTIGGIDLMGRSLTAALRKTAFVRRSAFGRRRVGMDSVRQSGFQEVGRKVSPIRLPSIPPRMSLFGS